MTESRRSNPQLPQSVDDALFAVVGAVQTAAEPPRDPSFLRDQLQALCDLARREALPVESLVVGLKSKLGDRDVFKRLPAHLCAHSQAVIISHLIAIVYSNS